MSDYYIYYRVNKDLAEAAREAVLAMIQRIEARTSVRGRWMQKAGEPLLWMEIYEDVRDEAAFERALGEESAQFPGFLQPGSVRKTERFVACA